MVYWYTCNERPLQIVDNCSQVIDFECLRHLVSVSCVEQYNISVRKCDFEYIVNNFEEESILVAVRQYKPHPFSDMIE